MQMGRWLQNDTARARARTSSARANINTSVPENADGRTLLDRFVDDVGPASPKLNRASDE